MKGIRTIVLLSLLTLSALVQAKQVKILSSRDGLSNNAILCMHQNSLGHLFLGTMDGLNIWDGHSMQTFMAADGKNYFFGNKIRHIIPGKGEKLYLLTTYGLAVLDTKTREVTFFENMAFSDIMTVTEDGNVFSINSHNKLQYLNTESSELRTFHGLDMNNDEECHKMSFASDGTLCLFTDRNIYLISFDHLAAPEIRKVECLNISCHFVTPKYDDCHHILYTSDNRICAFNSNDFTIETKATVKSALTDTDEVTGLIPSETTCLVGFRQNGIKNLDYATGRLCDTDIDSRVLSMIPDKRQPIIWVGTDCNGLIRWSDETTDISCITFDRLPYSIIAPVRSMYLDKDNDLWFGTKGDGLFRIRDFSPKSVFNESNTDRFATDNSRLLHDNIYSIVQSSNDFIWIGTDGRGLNCYSYRTGRLDIVKGSEEISQVHSILELNDSTLWVSTDGHGCWRCSFRVKGGKPEIYAAERLELIEPFNHKTSVYSIAQQDDSTLWFGSRRNGVLSYNINTDKSLVVQFPTKDGLAANETFYVAKSKEMLFATGNGVAAYSQEKDSVFVLDFIPKKATHAVLSDRNGNIWVTTNAGIISLDRYYNYRASFNIFSGLDVIEYSDGACHYDVQTNTIFFGGINGFTVIQENPENNLSAKTFNPEINIVNFIQNNAVSHISTKIKKGRLRIPYSQSVFGIEFSVIDNLNYLDYRFLYQIDGYSNGWTETPDNIIYMPLLSPGSYNLKIRYINQATGYESTEECLPIYIIPPVYRSWWAMALYVLLAILVIYKLIRQSRAKYAAMQEKLRKQYKKELLKVKSETISSVAEELTMQITYMLGLCQQIRSHTSGKSEVTDKVSLLEYNIAKINQTLHILNEYKGISEDSTGKVALIHASHIAEELLDIMKPEAHMRKVSVFRNIENDIIITINKEAFYTLFNTLIHAMVSICSGRKEVHLNLIRKGNREGILLSISASMNESEYQKTIAKMKHDSTLDDTDNDENGQNIEFVLCRKLINELKGVLDYNYDKKLERLNVDIDIPQHEMTGSPIGYVIPAISEDINSLVENHLPEKTARRQYLKTIYMVSTNKETSSFVSYFLSDRYNVCEFADTDSALSDIRSNMPVAIIYDYTSMNAGFPEFIENIRRNKITGQIPVLSLTSSLRITDREECIKLGADLCISFPFNTDYLQSALEKILNKRESIAEYYKSPLSAYVMKEGKILHRDEQDFMNRISRFIEDNLSNPQLNAAMIAQEIGVSERGIYRKIESITEKTLHQLIKESRIELATKLLTSSKLTIDEVMFKVGYENRSTFHRNFREAMGMAPKEYRQKVKNKALQTLTDTD